MSSVSVESSTQETKMTTPAPLPAKACLVMKVKGTLSVNVDKFPEKSDLESNDPFSDNLLIQIINKSQYCKPIEVTSDPHSKMFPGIPKAKIVWNFEDLIGINLAEEQGRQDPFEMKYSDTRISKNKYIYQVNYVIVATVISPAIRDERFKYAKLTYSRSDLKLSS